MTPGLNIRTIEQAKYDRDVIKPKEQRLHTVKLAVNEAAAKVATLEAALGAARESLAVAQDQLGKAQAELDAVVAAFPER